MHITYFDHIHPHYPLLLFLLILILFSDSPLLLSYHLFSPQVSHIRRKNGILVFLSLVIFSYPEPQVTVIMGIHHHACPGIVCYLLLPYNCWKYMTPKSKLWNTLNWKKSMVWNSSLLFTIYGSYMYKFAYPLKCICNIIVNTHGTSMVIQGYVQSSETFELLDPFQLRQNLAKFHILVPALMPQTRVPCLV
jgi:hypothetical protein